MKTNKISKRKSSIKVTVNIEKALGAAHRDGYLEENPHGFKKTNHVHKNKRKYNRKQKHKGCSNE